MVPRAEYILGLPTVWSVNYGLSGNLWKPPETGLGGFSAGFRTFLLMRKFWKKNHNNKIFKNLDGTDAAGFQKFPSGFHIIHHWWTTQYLLSKILASRCLMVSTNQADPHRFYFRISWILMEQCWFYFFRPLRFMQGLRSLKQWLL